VCDIEETFGELKVELTHFHVLARTHLQTIDSIITLVCMCSEKLKGSLYAE